MKLDVRQKLEILADAAKYDASCASSGSKRKRMAGDGIGNTEGMGICHSYTPDGRCVSLLKILLTNVCVFDCAYCINRASSSVQRARFTVEEVVQLVLDFYRRNYIEGLFLSSGIIRSADYTMEQLVGVARTLREVHRFGGYIHLKTIPEASPELIAQAGLDALAPEKRLVTIQRAMGDIRDGIAEAREAQAHTGAAPGRMAKPPAFAPAGQTTQMIVGATDATDATMLQASSALYTGQKLRRVYYSAFSPIPDASSRLPLAAPPLVREHRLYQADWLMRFYGFDASEITPAEQPNLDLAIDPKLSWALRNRGRFPVDVNTAPREELLRIPGVGARTVKRLLQVRRWHRVRLHDLVTLRVAMRRAMPFVITADHNPLVRGVDDLGLARRIAPARDQLDMFAVAASARSGEL